MTKVALSLFKSNAAIGTLQPDGSVLPSPEFVRAMSALFTRVGGATGMGADDLALLASTVSQPDMEARRVAADLVLNVPIDQGATIAQLARRVSDLSVLAAHLEAAQAELAVLRRKLAGAELLAGHRDPYRVNWERPGRIGFFKASAGAFTDLTAQTFNKVTIATPASSATLALADGATLTVPAPGGTLGSAAYQPDSAFVARTNTALAAIATDAASTQALANSMRALLISVGIGT